MNLQEKATELRVANERVAELYSLSNDENVFPNWHHALDVAGDYRSELNEEMEDFVAAVSRGVETFGPAELPDGFLQNWDWV